MPSVYFDNSATTQLAPAVLTAMEPYLKDCYGNSGSVHTFGQQAIAAVDEARDKISAHLGCAASEIIFTSGATESNNLAVLGVVQAAIKNKIKPHLITSQIEHPAILEVFKYLTKEGLAETTILNVDAAGVVKIENLPALIQDNTVLITVMYANNEVGSIQPIKQISEIVRSVRQTRGAKGAPIYLHTDAVQAFNYLACGVDELGVDLLSFSGHKIHAPKGIGVLYVRQGVQLQPITYGGHQERNLRPGTLNVPAIVALGRAVELVGLDQADNFKKVLTIKNKIVAGLQEFPDIKLNGAGDSQLPNIINVSFRRLEGESLLMSLDLAGFAVSTGSACASGALEPSHVLTAMGSRQEWSHGSIRISLGRFNTAEEADLFLTALKKIIPRLRAQSSIA